jgi:hypothetical protein
MSQRRCLYCKQIFQSSKYQPGQTVCSQPLCQQRRRSEYRRQRLSVIRSGHLGSVKAKVDMDSGRLQHANSLALALEVDMTKWFTPTAENFFSKVSKARVGDALTEAGQPTRPRDSKVEKGFRNGARHELILRRESSRGSIVLHTCRHAFSSFKPLT